MSDEGRAPHFETTPNNQGGPGHNPWARLTLLWVVATDALKGLDSELIVSAVHVFTLVLVIVPMNAKIGAYIVDDLTERFHAASRVIDSGWRRLRKLRKAANVFVKSLLKPFLRTERKGKGGKSRKTNHLHARAGKPTR